MNSFVKNDDFGDTSVKRRKIRSERCQCDVEFGTCPGVEICPYSGFEQGEDDEQESK